MDEATDVTYASSSSEKNTNKYETLSCSFVGDDKQNSEQVPYGTIDIYSLHKLPAQQPAQLTPQHHPAGSRSSPVHGGSRARNSVGSLSRGTACLVKGRVSMQAAIQHQDNH